MTIDLDGDDIIGIPVWGAIATDPAIGHCCKCWTVTVEFRQRRRMDVLAVIAEHVCPSSLVVVGVRNIVMRRIIRIVRFGFVVQ